MKHSLSVCLVGLSMAASVVAQAPAMQSGVSVEMASTTSAASLPDADREDAWVVTVTGDSKLYFGADLITPEGLRETMKLRPRYRWQELYVKADGRAPFRSVEQVLETAHTALFDRAFLLTAQPDVAATGTMVPPKGLEVWLAPAANADVVVVQIGDYRGSAKLKVNNEDIPPKALQSKLEELLQNKNEKVVMLQSGGKVPFAHIVHVVDVCHMAGAKPLVSKPEL